MTDKQRDIVTRYLQTCWVVSNNKHPNDNNRMIDFYKNYFKDNNTNGLVASIKSVGKAPWSNDDELAEYTGQAMTAYNAAA